MSHRKEDPERDEKPSSRGHRKQKEQSRAPGIRRGGRRPDLLLERALDEFLYHYQQVSSARTVAAYAGHLGVFYTWLSEYLDRTPLLSDLTLEIVDIWSRSLSQRPRRLAAGLVQGDGPIAWETRRTYLRTLRTFSNWLPRPPHCFCAEPPLKHLLLPRASDTYKMPLSEQELARLVAATREDSIRGARDTADLCVIASYRHRS